jgi:hypothetical protein
MTPQLTAQEKRGYDMYKERMSNLLNAIDQQNPVGSPLRSMLFDAVESGIKNFVDYVNAVYNMETRVAIAKFRADSPAEYQGIVNELDTGRRYAHEAAIASINMIDRICDKLGVEPVYGGSQDRTEIGDFCGKIVGEYFDGRSVGRVILKEDVEQVLEEEMGFERE